MARITVDEDRLRLLGQIQLTFSPFPSSKNGLAARLCVSA